MSNIPTILPQVERKNANDIIVCTYNILLPNHSSWWVFKYYQSDSRGEISSWSYRKKRLQEQLDEIDADLISLQETFPDSFDDDFDFLLRDYDGVCHRKSRIACAAFWRKDRFQSLAVRQRDRSIITILQDRNQRIIAFVSCHLNAGQQPKRRFQQVFAICQQLWKESERYDIDLFVLAGDFNATGERTAVQELLIRGAVEPSFREEQYPEEEISSKRREQRLGSFTDIYASIGFFPTMVVLNARERILDWETKTLRQEYVKVLTSLFKSFARGPEMKPSEVESWAMCINKGLRGSEYRRAIALAEDGRLDLTAFIALHREEALQGKAWSLYSDLAELGFQLPQIGAKSNHFALDRIWFRSTIYHCPDLRYPIAPADLLRIEQGDYAPNAWHPSDHFPLVARFSLSSEAGVEQNHPNERQALPREDEQPS